jgi:hypothetical protein
MNKAPEELPRYIIDQDEPKVQSKILPEEQKRVLSKLLRTGGHALGEEERELMEKLQEKLQQEIERIRALRKMTVGDKPLDSFLNAQGHKGRNHKQAGSHSHHTEPIKSGEPKDSSVHAVPPNGDTEDVEETPVQRRVVSSIVGFKPEEVVQRYIECWNQQKFGAEFDCFSSDFMRTDRQAYIEARHKYFQQQLQVGGMRIQLGEIISSDNLGGVAEVVAKKLVQQGTRKAVEEIDLYRLRLEGGRWVITGVEVQNGNK